MPIQYCKVNGKKGYRWGRKGKCYSARAKALRQARAIKASQALNSFCPNGPGGGVDPTCSPGAAQSVSGKDMADARDEVFKRLEEMEDSGQDSSKEYDGLSVMYRALAVGRGEAVVSRDSEGKIVAAGSMSISLSDPSKSAIEFIGSTQKGGGSSVMRKLLDMAKEKGVKEVTADASPEAIPLNKKFGFAVVGKLSPNGTPMRLSLNYTVNARPLRNPLKLDPTRTAALRRAFSSALKKRFRKLRMEVMELVDREDVFGLKVPVSDLSIAANVFCATGPGGGVDPSCSPSGSRVTLGGKDISIDFDSEVTSRDTIAKVKGWLDSVPKEELAKSTAKKVEVYDNPEDLQRRLDEVGIEMDHGPNGLTRGAFDFSTGTLYASVWDGHQNSPRTLFHEIGHSILGMDENRAESWAQKFSPPGFVGVLNTFCATGKGGGVDSTCSPKSLAPSKFSLAAAYAKSLPAQTLTKIRDVAKSKHAQLEKRYGSKYAKAIIGAAMMMAPTTTLVLVGVAEMHRLISPPTKNVEDGPRITDEQIQAEARRLLEEIDLTDNSFCPTGPGGGVDPTCSPKSEDGALVSKVTVDEKKSLNGPADNWKVDHKHLLGHPASEGKECTARECYDNARVEFLARKALGESPKYVVGHIYGYRDDYAEQNGLPPDLSKRGFPVKHAWVESEGKIYDSTPFKYGIGNFSDLPTRLSKDNWDKIAYVGDRIVSAEKLGKEKLTDFPTGNIEEEHEMSQEEIDEAARKLLEELERELEDEGIRIADNSFCPTGPGGGVDPTCSPGGDIKGLVRAGLVQKDVLADFEKELGKGKVTVKDLDDAGNLDLDRVMRKGAAKWETVADLGPHVQSGGKGSVMVESATAFGITGYRWVERSAKGKSLEKSHAMLSKDDAIAEAKDYAAGYPFLTGNQRWRFNTTAEKVKAFQAWLKARLKELIHSEEAKSVWQHYIEEGMKKGCVLGDTVIDGAVVKTVFKRWYSGLIVEIKTASGHGISVTPNHPMLTELGWVPAHRLKNGDNLVCCTGGNRVDRRDPNVQRAPTSISKIFDSLSVLHTVERVVGDTVDFHGDGTDSEVNILGTDSELGYGAFTPVNKHTAKFLFPATDQLASDRLGVCGECGYSLTDKCACFTTISQFDSSLDESMLSCLSITSETFGNRSERLSRGISFNDYTKVNIISEMAGSLSSCTGRKTGTREGTRYAGVGRDFGDDTQGMSCFESDLSLAESREVELDYVVSITVRQFSGHVYNLETKYGYYIANSLYTKNCSRAFDDTRKIEKTKAAREDKLDFYNGTRQEFLRSAFNQPVAVEKVQLLAGRTFDELENVTTQMSTAMSRTLTDGLVQGKSPREIAKDLGKSVEGLGEKRALVVAQTEIIRAHADGQLEAMEQLGVEEVGVSVEWSGSGLGVTKKGNPSPCPACAPLVGVVLTLAEAKGKIPYHPNCRCSWTPAGVGESTQGQKSSQAAIKAAVKESVKRGGVWGKTPIAKKRTRSILGNVFCATGPGGGIDPTCSPSDSGRTSMGDMAVLDKWVQKTKVVMGFSGASQDPSSYSDKDYERLPLVYRGGKMSGEHIYVTNDPNLAAMHGHVTAFRLSPGTPVYADPEMEEEMRGAGHRGAQINGHTSLFKMQSGSGIVPRSKLWPKNRPASVINQQAHPTDDLLLGEFSRLLNVFCPTGPGGGVNPHCSPGGAPAQKQSGLPVGSVFTKKYKGNTYTVTVEQNGFKVDGPYATFGTKTYSSLTAAAKGVRENNKPINGWAFFKIDKPTGAVAPPPQTQPTHAPKQPHSTIPFKDEHDFETGKPQPGVLNGIPFASAPPKFWEKTPDAPIKEHAPVHKIQRSTVMVEEPDGRVWIVQPTNAFGDRKYTLPGGTNEPHLTNQQNALKEVWEETGLQVEITGHLGDFQDSNNGRYGRLYKGRRIGGAPWDAKIENSIRDKNGNPAAESEKVSLVTKEIAAQRLHRTDDLAQLATVAPIALGTNPTKNVMSKIVEGLKPAAQSWEKEQRKQNKSVGDSMLHAVQELRGFNGRPVEISKSAMDSLIASGGHIEMLRGIKGSGSLSAKDLTGEFKRGDHYPGFGCFGSGTYADSNRGSGNVATGQYGRGGDTVRMALPKTAKIIKQSELESKVKGLPSEYRPYTTHSNSDTWLGAHAALAGYDAIHVDGGSSRHGSYGQGFYVILNRSVLTVQKESAKGHVIQ